MSSKPQLSLVVMRPVPDRIITACFQTQHIKISVVQLYAPTEVAEYIVKDAFYNQLQEELELIHIRVIPLSPCYGFCHVIYTRPR